MWRGLMGWSNEGGVGLKTWVRYMSKQRAENLRKINPKVPYPEAISLAQSLYNVVKDRGPLTIGGAWTNAQEAGVNGLNSKTHMKIMLKWMRGKKMLKQICQHVGSSKKFLLCTPEALPSVQEKMSTEIKLHNQKSSKKGKKTHGKKGKKRIA